MSDKVVINLEVTKERLKEFPLTMDEYIDMEEGKVKAVRDMMARFVVDEAGNYLPIEQAKRIVGKIPMDEEIGERMADFQRKVQAALVPPTKATG
jgi:hypothetical protein